MKISQSAAAVIRLCCTLAAGILTLVGVATDADVLITGVASVIALVCLVYSWWKNSNITDAAQAAQDILDAIKDGADDAEEDCEEVG